MSATRRRKNGAALRLSKARLAEMVEEAAVDAYGESEQTTGWFTMIDQNLAVPFETTVLEVALMVERIDLNASEQIVAVCRPGQRRNYPRKFVEVVDGSGDATTSDVLV